MSKKITTFISCLLIAGFMLNSCKANKNAEGRNIICLVDFSESVSSEERLAFYMSAIRNHILSKLSYHDRITVMPVDRASLTNAAELLTADLSKVDFEPENASPMEEEQIMQTNLQKYKDSLALSFAAKFEQAVTSRNKTKTGTDIFGALEVIKNRTNAPGDNVMILFSDMMNYSPVLKMEPSNRAFKRNTLNSCIDNVPSVSLQNTTVLVITADQSHIPADHFSLVQSFWKLYFEKNNIRLYDYSSSSLNKLDELMTASSE